MRIESIILHPWQSDAALAHIFAGFVGIGGLAGAIAFQKEELADALAGVDFRRQRRVLEISMVTWPSHSGSRGVTFTMMPQRA